MKKPIKKKKIAAKPVKVYKKIAARKTPLPKSAPAVRREITHAMIAKRAYEISLGSGGDEMHNWLAAERELRGL